MFCYKIDEKTNKICAEIYSCTGYGGTKICPYANTNECTGFCGIEDCADDVINE